MVRALRGQRRLLRTSVLASRRESGRRGAYSRD